MAGTQTARESCRLWNTLNWIARISSLAMTGLFLSFLMGEETRPVLSQEPLNVQLIFAGWAVIFLGYLVGWRHQILGGVLVLTALLFMNFVEYFTNNRHLGPAFLLWAIPGVLFLLGACTKKLMLGRQSSLPSTTSP